MSSSGQILKAALDAFAVVGGTTASSAGFIGAVLLFVPSRQSSEMANAVSYGIAIGGVWGVPAATALFILELAQVIS